MADAAKETTTTSGNSAPEATQAPANSIENKEVVQATEKGADEASDENAEMFFPITVTLPHGNIKLQLSVSSSEQIHEVRQAIIEQPEALRYSCFNLEHKGEKINEFVQVSDVKGLGAGSELQLVEAPYTERDARFHFVRVRELIGAAGDRVDTFQGLLSGLSVYDDVAAAAAVSTPEEEYDFTTPPSLSTVLPKETDPAPKTIKAISLSAWNPPPVYWRQKGHLLYLIVTTNEGEQHQLTSHVGGFYINRSSNTKFDPTPRPPPKDHSSHSLLTLIEDISPSFRDSFTQLQEHLCRRDPLTTFQMGNAIPAAPWVIPPTSSTICSHVPDITRSQETFLFGGAENTESLRDWNEEFQTARELPKESVQDRIFRERLLAKIFAEYNDAAVRGATLVARGEIPPMNPTEGQDAQIFVHNNVFYSFGADGVGTFTTEGGDEAARVASGKDVNGVKLVNQLDVDGLFTPGTVVVDYLGKRIVGQSIVPGIFKQPEEGENQIQYGALEGKEKVAAEEKFASSFEKVARLFHVKKHAVWDKDGKRFDLEASVEMKGLLGSDARKYILDLYRITPLDIAWMEGKSVVEGADYPHRMTVLRPELVEALYRQKVREYMNAELEKRRALKKAAAEETKTKKDEICTEKTADSNDKKDEKAAEETAVGETSDKKEPEAEDRIDLSNFKFALNPDVLSGQAPQTDAEKEEYAADEKDVRDACAYLTGMAIPGLLNDLKENDTSFPMDGRSLTRLLHRRGINMRYVGQIASLCEGISKLDCLRILCVREIITRSFKHVASKYLKYLPLPLTSACYAHLLNCLLGTGLNPRPTAEVDEYLRSLYNDVELGFVKVTPESLRDEVQHEAAVRFRFVLGDGWWNESNQLHLLREVSIRLGIQLQAKTFAFKPEDVAEPAPVEKPAVNGNTNGDGKRKKRKGARDASPASAASSTSVPHTFSPDDIVNVTPIVKDSAPRSTLAEEALEAGRISVQQGQRKIGQELLLESLTLHEQIYGLIHPETAQVYHTLSQIYYSLDEKEAAAELARKSAIISERTMGVDSADAVLIYLELSLFLHQIGDSKSALAHAKHALALWKVMYGPDHPDSITILNNAAVILQSLKLYRESRRWFEESLRVCEKVFGKQSVSAATLLFQLAQALALDQDSKAAVTRMKESFNIFKAILGPEDKNTKEAENWLEQLTQNAVSVARQEKDAQARRLRAGIRFVPRTTGLVPPANQPASMAGKPPGPSIDGRSIDELIKFIEGNDKQTKSSATKKRAGRGNPKRRGGAGAISTTA